MLSKKLQAACNAPEVVDTGGIMFIGSAKYESVPTLGGSSYNYDDVTISFSSTAVPGTQAGDFAFIYVCNDDNNSQTGNPSPTEWSTGGLSDYGTNCRYYFRTLTDSSTAFSVVWGDTTGTPQRVNPVAIMMVFRNANLRAYGFHSEYDEDEIPSSYTYPETVTSPDATDAMVTFVGNAYSNTTPSWPTSAYSDSAVSASNNFNSAVAGYDLNPAANFSTITGHDIYSSGGLRGVTLILKETNPEAQGTLVASNTLPSTVVCYTHGMGDGKGNTTIDGWYRTSDGNLYKSDELFQAKGSTGQTYYRGYNTYGSPWGGGVSRAIVETPGEFYEQAGYDAGTTSAWDGDHPLFIDAYGSSRGDRWVNTWMRDYLPAQVQAGANSLCIEFWMFNIGLSTSNKYSWWAHYGGYWSPGHGFDMWNWNYYGYGAYARPIIYSGTWTTAVGGSLNTSDTYGPDYWKMEPRGFAEQSSNTNYGAAWFHWSFLWDFENGRIAIHRNGVEIVAATNTTTYTAANFDPVGTYGNASQEVGAFVFGCPSEYQNSYGYTEAMMSEIIVSIDDTTKQSRWGNSFTPSTTPLIEGGDPN